MATAVAALEDLATCPVCFEVYINPQSLSCLHTLCKKCVEQIVSEDAEIECPQCREVTEFTSMKNDFTKQTLVDLYITQKQGLVHVKDTVIEKKELETLQQGAVQNIPALICETCKKVKDVEWKCEQCKNFMCVDCESAHSNFPATENHHVIAIEKITKDIKGKLRKTVDELSLVVKGFEEKVKMRGDTLDDLDTIKEEIVMAVNEKRDKLKECIDKQHDKELVEFDRKICEIINEGVENRAAIKNCIIDINGKIFQITDMIGNNDTKILVKESENMKNKIEADIQKMTCEIEKMEDFILPQVKITDQIFLNETTGTFIKMNTNPQSPKVGSDADTNSLNQDPPPDEDQDLIKEISAEDFVLLRSLDGQVNDRKNSGYLKYFDSEKVCLQKVSSRNLGYEPSRLNAVGETLWCTGADGVEIYDKECNFIIAFKDDKIKDSTCILKDNLGHILAASHWKLQQLDSAGKYLTELCHGNINDLAIRGNVLYALDSRKQCIIVFEYKETKSWMGKKKNKWVLIKTINLNRERQTLAQNQNRKIMNICVSDEFIYASSWEGDECHSLYKISNCGSVMLRIAGCKDERGETPRIWKPRMCSTDEWGHVMVAADTLMIYDTDGNYHKVNLEPCAGEGRPLDAVVDTDRKNMWVVTDDGKLVKYVAVVNNPE